MSIFLQIMLEATGNIFEDLRLSLQGTQAYMPLHVCNSYCAILSFQVESTLSYQNSTTDTTCGSNQLWIHDTVN